MEWRHWVRDGHAVFNRMARLRPPLIAAIEGLALGGGLELAATCDLRIGGADAVFGLPEADVGVVPGWSGTQRLVREIGPAPVKLMALAGERLDAAAAERAGVLHRTVSAGTALDAALDMHRRARTDRRAAHQATHQCRRGRGRGSDAGSAGVGYRRRHAGYPRRCGELPREAAAGLL